MDALEELDSVPQTTAANPDGGAAKLDPDPITPDVHDALDNLLDQAEAETSGTSQHLIISEATNGNDYTRNLPSTETQETPLATPIEPIAKSAITADTLPTQQVPIEPRIEIDPEIAAIEQPRNLSEKNQNNWRKLQETATNYKKQFEETQKYLSQQQQQPQTPPDYEELKRFKQIFDIKNDPSFKSKYEAPISSAKENVYGLLKNYGAPEELIANIEAAGGPDKIDQNWWKTNVIDKLPPIDAAEVTDGIRGIRKLKQEQEKEIAHAAEHAEEILGQKEVQQREWYQTETSNITNYVEQLTENVPWARYQQFPENATQEQIEKIQQHNASVQSLEQKFNSALWPQNATERASIAAAAVLSHRLTEQLKVEQQGKAEMQNQLRRLTEENNKLKASGKMPRQSVNTPSTIKTNDLNSRIRMNASDAIDLGLEEAGG
jgi:hypothetical protein